MNSPCTKALRCAVRRHSLLASAEVPREPSTLPTCVDLLEVGRVSSAHFLYTFPSFVHRLAFFSQNALCFRSGAPVHLLDVLGWCPWGLTYVARALPCAASRPQWPPGCNSLMTSRLFGLQATHRASVAIVLTLIINILQLKMVGANISTVPAAGHPGPAIVFGRASVPRSILARIKRAVQWPQWTAMAPTVDRASRPLGATGSHVSGPRHPAL